MIDDPLIGYQLGNFRIERLIGRGGMAQVYYGWDQSLQRPVAVKVIDVRFRGTPAYAQRLVQEARSVATWRHENILQVYYAGNDEGLYYFAMEYIDGLDLGQIMARYAHDGELMPHEDVLRIGRTIAEALDYAHSRQVIHRDVKPSNVMIARDGRVALADFGLAMDIQQGSLGETFGTPHYVAPEQARNSANAIAQSDLYSLGIILYEMLTGMVPFDDPSPTSVALQHLTLPPPPPRAINPKLNAASEAVLLKALSKKPEERYQSGRALLAALEKALAEGVVETAGSSAPPLLPVGFSAPSPRTLSQTSVVERVSLREEPPPPLPPPPASPGPAALTPLRPTATPPPPAATLSRPITVSLSIPGAWLATGAGVILLLLLAAVFLWLRPDEEETAAIPTLPTTMPEVPTEVATGIAAVGGPTIVATVTAESIPPTGVVPTEAPVIDNPPANQTVPPAQPTAAAAPTGVSTPTSVPIAPTEQPAAPPPTIAFPNGRRIELLYDAYSFYLWNPNSERIAIRSIAFEALDGNGNSAGYYFDGTLWTQFYSFVEERSCNRIEMTGVPGHLRPPQCQGYNATVTPTIDDDLVFWTQRPGVSRFRVLWGGQEIARCELTGGRCEVFLP
jgi:serine/threonine protein kinase